MAQACQVRTGESRRDRRYDARRCWVGGMTSRIAQSRARSRSSGSAGRSSSCARASSARPASTTSRAGSGSRATCCRRGSSGWSRRGSSPAARYQERPPRFEYRLTQEGRDLLPVLVALLQWGDRHRAPAGPRGGDRPRQLRRGDQRGASVRALRGGRRGPQHRGRAAARAAHAGRATRLSSDRVRWPGSRCVVEQVRAGAEQRDEVGREVERVGDRAPAVQADRGAQLDRPARRRRASPASGALSSRSARRRRARVSDSWARRSTTASDAVSRGLYVSVMSMGPMCHDRANSANDGS